MVPVQAPPLLCKSFPYSACDSHTGPGKQGLPPRDDGGNNKYHPEWLPLYRGALASRRGFAPAALPLEARRLRRIGLSPRRFYSLFLQQANSIGNARENLYLLFAAQISHVPQDCAVPV